VPIKNRAAATKTSLPRLESSGLSTDMSCLFFLAGHTNPPDSGPAHGWHGILERT
jgi:hypothetical protein